MKPFVLTLLLAAMLPLASTAADAPHSDPLAGAFFPPELVFQVREQIGLTSEQSDALQAKMEKTQPKFEDVRSKLEREAAAFAALVQKDHVEEAALLAQLDKVLDAEREAKHLQIGLLVSIKNALTPEQLTKLRALAKSGSPRPEEMRQRLMGKLDRVRAAMQKSAENGRDPSAIGETMATTVKPLIDAGKITEAEAELDKLLAKLEKDAK